MKKVSLLEMPVVLERFKSIIEGDRLIHFFHYYGAEENVTEVAIKKAKELDGEYLITKNASKKIINIIISYPL